MACGSASYRSLMVMATCTRAAGFGWPYSYGQYQGFINITVSGSRFYQHNIFVYPPADAAFCDETANPVPAGKVNAYGSGVCGVTGGAKSFEAFGTSSYEKDGSMHGLPDLGTYGGFVNIARPIDDKTLLYTSTDETSQFHSQTNVFYPDDDAALLDALVMWLRVQLRELLDRHPRQERAPRVHVQPGRIALLARDRERGRAQDELHLGAQPHAGLARRGLRILLGRRVTRWRGGRWRDVADQCTLLLRHGSARRDFAAQPRAPPPSRAPALPPPPPPPPSARPH